MKKTNLKYKNYESSEVDVNPNNGIKNYETDSRPACPQCGNLYLNYLVVSKNEWHCSRKQCRKVFKELSNSFKSNK